MGLGSKGDTDPAWVLDGLGERLTGSGIGLRAVARGKGTVEEEEDGWALHVGDGWDVVKLYGGVHGVVDMLHHDEHLKLDPTPSLPTSHVTNIKLSWETTSRHPHRPLVYIRPCLQNTRHPSMKKAVLRPWSDR